jgi:hypothetical protein
MKRGRPRIYKSLELRHIRIPQPIISAIQEFASKNRISESEAIRRLLVRGIAQIGPVYERINEYLLPFYQSYGEKWDRFCREVVREKTEVFNRKMRELKEEHPKIWDDFYIRFNEAYRDYIMDTMGIESELAMEILQGRDLFYEMDKFIDGYGRSLHFFRKKSQ